MTLNGSILKAYNNLPAIPPEQPLGDLLNTLPVGNPALENPTGGYLALYVSSAGSDDTGDGSQTSPFATPQAAVDALPATIDTNAIVEIFCGAGTFPFPDLSRVPYGLHLALIGDLSNPAISIPAGTPFSQLAGKKARFQGAVGAYSATITDGSHWAYLSKDVLGTASQGLVVAASTSPNLELIEGFDYASFADLVVYPYATTFVTSGGAPAYRGNTQVNFKRAQLVGIVVDVPAVSLELDSISLFGCKITTAIIVRNYNNSVTCYSPSTTIGLYDNSSCSDSYLKVSSGCYRVNQINGSVVNTISVFNTAALYLGTCDFEQTGSCFSTSDNASIVINGSISVANTKSSVMTLATNASLAITANVSGSVTGNAITLTRGAQARGVETNCSGTLTAGGSEIVVGGNAGQTFASLPATDLAAGNPQLCRAE